MAVLGSMKWFMPLALAVAACAGDDAGDDASDGGGDAAFVAGSVVFGPESQLTYVQLLDHLERPTLDRSLAAEFPGWADTWVWGDKVFVASGESPEIRRYTAGAGGALVADGTALSFAAYGAATVQFWGHLFVDEHKAYWFNTDEREVVVWDPTDMVIEGTFPMPALPERSGGLKLAGPTADRSSVVRGDRAFVPFYWANWTSADMADDSVVLVIDTASDQVIETLSIPCPELNFATVDDEGVIYLSNWGYSVILSLVDGHAPACAVRVLPGDDQIDAGWTLRFADLTEGREAANLRFLGERRALLTVFHHERVDLGAADPFALIDSANWRLWMVDLDARTAAPLETFDWHAPGIYSVRLGGEMYASLPAADYSSTATYTIALDGSAVKRFESTGWLTRLFQLQ